MSTHISEAAKQAAAIAHRVFTYEELEKGIQSAIDAETKQWLECAEKLVAFVGTAHNTNCETKKIYFSEDGRVAQKAIGCTCKQKDVAAALAALDTLNRTNP